MKYINHWSLADFSQLLASQQILKSKLSDIQIAGEGNMNYAYRLSFEDGSTLVVKQAPPFCAKFPQIPAPVIRINSEQKYYKLVNELESLRVFSPQILGFDDEQKILLMSDLGKGVDFEKLYSGQKLQESELEVLSYYLSELHQIKAKTESFKNSQMRELNYDYIFHLPFEGHTGVINLDDITPGLNAISVKLKGLKKVKARVRELGEIYLLDADCLIHGDFYPRSWLKSDNKIFVIDPEFGFVGKAEFDIAVFLAHMAMSEQFQYTLTHLKKSYRASDSFDWNLVFDFCATEILRRILFVSQLPIRNDFTFKEGLCNYSIKRLEDSTYDLGDFL